MGALISMFSFFNVRFLKNFRRKISGKSENFRRKISGYVNMTKLKKV